MGYSCNVVDATTPRVNPYVINLKVEGNQLLFEIDTGASFSLVSEATYHELWPNRPLHDTQYCEAKYIIQVHNYKYLV